MEQKAANRKEQKVGNHCIDDGAMSPQKRRKINGDTDPAASNLQRDFRNGGNLSSVPVVSAFSSSSHQANSKGEETHAHFWDDKDDLLQEVLKYLDVASLVEKKQVCTHWKNLCTRTIDQKNGDAPRPFQSRDELREAILKYVSSVNNPQDAEEISASYGWPIGTCLSYTSPSPRD